MTTFSRFVRFGNGARFSNKVPQGRRIFEDMVRNLGGDGKNYDLDPDSLAGARVFSTAMLLARVYYTQFRAGQQFRPLKAVELLPALENEVGSIPEPEDTIPVRQRTVAAYMKIPRGARRDNVIAVLEELLGDDFIAYRTVPIAQMVVSHADPTTVGVYVKPGTLRSLFQLGDAVSLTGIPLTVPYTPIAGASTRLIAGDRVIIDPGNHGNIEALTISAATPTTFTATFTRPHNANVRIATGRHPHLLTSKRENLVVLSPGAAISGRKRTKANRALRRLVRGISTWHLSEETTPGAGTTGPFKVGQGKLGITTIGEVSL